MTDLPLVFAIGLLGSAHCVGMCGGFVLALGHLHDRPRTLQLYQALYFLGKTVTYALFGAVAGGFGATLGLAFTGVQSVLAVVVGVLLVVVGLGLLGVLRRFEGVRSVAGVRWLSEAIGRLMARRSAPATFALGMLNGVLPCGLVYAMLAKAAATGSVLAGAATMAVFGLATIPALYALTLAGFFLRPVWRARLNMAGGVLVVALGLLTIARGTPAAGLLHGGHEAGATEHVEPAASPAASPHAHH